jgi:chaperone modulatory protein CbpM
MNRDELFEILTGEIVDEEVELSFAELCRSCELPATRVVELVEHGIIEPLGAEPGIWRFRAISIRRVRSVQRLERDLGVNTAGAALALDLLSELAELRSRLADIDA